MARVFISYSRREKDFAAELQTTLAAAGRDVWVDLQDIPPTAEWLKEIYAGIEASDAFLCVLSPAYIASEICAEELAYALKSKKRIVPVVRADVDPRQVNPEIATLNWIFFRPGDNAAGAFQQLTFALDTDLVYWRKSSEILVHARQWERKRRNASLTLRGSDLAEAERWLAEGADKRPSPSALQTEFVTASRRSASGRLRIIIGALSVGLIITLLLSIFSTIQYQTAQQENRQLLARSLAGASSAALASDDISQALLLAVEASRREDSFDTRNALFSALQHSPYLDTVLQEGADAQHPSEYGIRVAYSQDGKTLLYAGSTGRTILWDTTSKRTRAHFTFQCAAADPAASPELWDATISPDGSQVATLAHGCAQPGVDLWDAASGKVSRHLAAGGPIGGTGAQSQLLAFSPDGQEVAAPGCSDAQCTREVVYLWNVETGQVLQEIPGIQGANFVYLAFSPDSKRLAIGDLEHVFLWNIVSQTSSPVFTSPSYSGPQYDELKALAFSPDGKQLAVAGSQCNQQGCPGGALLFIDMATMHVTTTTQYQNSIDALAFSQDGGKLITTSGNNLELWDPLTAQPTGNIPLLAGHSSYVNSVAISPDGIHIASTGVDDKVLVWLEPPTQRYHLQPPLYLDGFIANLLLAPDGKHVVTILYSDYTAAHSTAAVFDLASNTMTGIYQLPNRVNAQPIYSPDSAYIAIPGDTSVSLWNPATGTVAGAPFELPDGESDGIYLSLSFSPNGQYLGDHLTASALGPGDAASVIWNVSSRQVLSFIPRSSNGFAFSPDGRQVAVAQRGGASHAITFWDLATGRLMRTLTGSAAEIESLAFSPDSHTLATIDSAGTATLWDLATGKPTANFVGGTSPWLGFYQISFSPDGRLVMAADGRNITLWDVPARQLYVQPIVDPATFTSAAFSPDGRLLVEGQQFGAVLLRTITVSDWRTLACAIANRNLTRQEWQEFLGSEPYRATCPGAPGA